ncbi:DciA family protein [Nocardia asiatica]|uniref:DciA family protein n=1 Tax=Nocardia asiatica TaxID=209252 RepID=UPI0005C21C06|nr:DciA family protein [Nocardia asiatica]
MHLGRWEDLVGAELAARSLPITLQDGVLTVIAASRARAAVLRAQQVTMLERIHAVVGRETITALQIKNPTVTLAEEYALLGELLEPVTDELAARRAGATSTRIPTGFTGFDEIVDGGLERGTLTVLAGVPGSGTSTLAHNLLRFAAVRRNIHATYLALNTTPATIKWRLLAAEAGIKVEHLQAGWAPRAKRESLANSKSVLAAAPLAIEQPVDRDITDLTKLIMEMADAGTRLVVIDPLHRITARSDLPYENRERETAEVTRRLKSLALDTDTAIVTTTHLTPRRYRINNRPYLHDLSYSGSIAHVADLVVLLHRPDLWDEDDPNKSEITLIVDKHRHGRTRVQITLEHRLAMSSLVDIGNHPEPVLW